MFVMRIEGFDFSSGARRTAEEAAAVDMLLKTAVAAIVVVVRPTAVPTVPHAAFLLNDQFLGVAVAVLTVPLLNRTRRMWRRRRRKRLRGDSDCRRELIPLCGGGLQLRR